MPEYQDPGQFSAAGKRRGGPGRAFQFVRKLSGANRPPRVNEAAFDRAVDQVTLAASRLIGALTTSAPPRDREEEARKGRERAQRRFAGDARAAM